MDYFYDINFNTLPTYVKHKKIERKGILNDKSLISLLDMYKETKYFLKIIEEQGGPTHFMESPVRFITEYNQFYHRLQKRLRFRQVLCNWWVKRQFLQLYQKIISCTY